MYVCLCNALTDSKVRELAQAGISRVRDVYAGCGCITPCGRCAPSVLTILREPRGKPTQR